MVTAEISGQGTDEAQWRDWLQRAAFMPFPSPAPGRRVVVVAAHPDDEVLGIGGLLGRLARSNPVVMVWATDGEASHPGSTALRPSRLADIRRDESQLAMSQLGLAPLASHHLGLPDSGLAAHRAQLEARLRELIEPTDLVLSTWHDDGHPDHETVGAVCARVATDCVQFPIWLWHWSAPADPRVPWRKARRIANIDVDAKSRAIAAFASQVEPIGPDPADSAILPPHVVAHFVRPVEIVFLP